MVVVVAPSWAILVLSVLAALLANVAVVASVATAFSGTQGRWLPTRPLQPPPRGRFAIDDPQTPSRQLARCRRAGPVVEVDRRGGVVLELLQGHNDRVLDPSLPSLRRGVGDLHGSQVGVVCSTCEGEPDQLGDGARVGRPGPQIDGLRVRRRVEVGLDPFERTGAANDALCQLSRPGVSRDAVETELDAEEEGHPFGVADASPLDEKNFDATTFRRAFLQGHRTMAGIFELDKEGLREMAGHLHLVVPQVELFPDGRFHLRRPSGLRAVHRPGDGASSVPVAQTVVDDAGGLDEAVLSFRPGGKVAEARHLGPRRRLGRRREFLVASAAVDGGRRLR
ncbi:hypothetical protein PVAP13_1NG137119 [Panicum virgatum]|uniref:Uncharacterized protein n=1 Tax=Panicum virgatum TaxID=38727 RepID=A0A8T0WWX9_PANVG|nr:hypothetical protein PVAP13_1NG137119 [Panicum virgatum]